MSPILALPGSSESDFTSTVHLSPAGVLPSIRGPCKLISIPAVENSLRRLSSATDASKFLPVRQKTKKIFNARVRGTRGHHNQQHGNCFEYRLHKDLVKMLASHNICYASFFSRLFILQADFSPLCLIIQCRTFGQLNYSAEDSKRI